MHGIGFGPVIGGEFVVGDREVSQLFRLMHAIVLKAPGGFSGKPENDPQKPDRT